MLRSTPSWISMKRLESKWRPMSFYSKSMPELMIPNIQMIEKTIPSSPPLLFNLFNPFSFLQKSNLFWGIFLAVKNYQKTNKLFSNLEFWKKGSSHWKNPGILKKFPGFFCPPKQNKDGNRLTKNYQFGGFLFFHPLFLMMIFHTGHSQQWQIHW